MDQDLLYPLRHETLEALDQVFVGLSILSEIAEGSIHLFFHQSNRAAANRFLDIMEINLMGVKTILQVFDTPSGEEFKKLNCKTIGMRDVCNLILIYLRRFLINCVQVKTLLNNMQELNDPNWDDGKCDKLEQENRLFAILVGNLSNLCKLANNSKRIYAAIAKALNADLTKYPKLPIVSLTMTHLMLSSADASTFEAALKVLNGFEFFNVIDETQYPIFKEARIFIKDLISCDDTFFEFLYVYKIFNVNKDLESSINNEEKSQLRKELQALLKEDVYLIPNTQLWAGYRFCDGSFSIAIQFLNAANEDYVTVRTAQTVLIILHGLSHKVEIKRQTQAKYPKEAGFCLEKQIFGTVIDDELLKITLPIAKKLLDKNCWKNGSIIDHVFKKLVDISSKSGTPFSGYKCGKEDFNNALEAESDADKYMRSQGINID